MRAVNCGAIPEQLIESALFGHERGAFTGAAQRTRGVFEEADGGTVFLDEIGELSRQAQAALLRVLETRCLSRVGSHKEIEVDVRIVAATNRDLERMCDAGTFRWDLLYRLNTMTIRLPPLRERSEEVQPLVEQFIAQANQANGCRVWGIQPEALALLRRYTWPGNVRELRNVIERAVVLARNSAITVDDLAERVRNSQGPYHAHRITSVRDVETTNVEPVPNAELLADDPGPEPEPLGNTGRHARCDEAPPVEQDFKTRVQHFEKLVVLHAVSQTRGNQARAARLLQMPLRTLFYKIRVYRLRDPSEAAQLLEGAQALLGDDVLEVGFKRAVQRYEAQLIRDALRRCGGTKTRTARLLGVSQRTLTNKLAACGLE